MIPVYVNEIKDALDNKCYFPALALALTIPDMCGIVEFPKADVGKRYINWIDKYLGEYFANKKGSICENNPYLTGEVIYNLRNTFLHQGSPNIQQQKIKEETNQVDRFVLILGDSSIIWSATLNFQSPLDKDLEFKAIFVDVTYLCDCICDCALWYFQQNEKKFKFDFYAMTQEDFIKQSQSGINIDNPEWAAELVNQKLQSMGSTKRASITSIPVSFKTEVHDKKRKY